MSYITLLCSALCLITACLILVVMCAFAVHSGSSHTVQKAIDDVIGTIGTEQAQRLWHPLLAAQAEQPVKLQWLPLLACWLTSPSPPSYADLEPPRAARLHTGDVPEMTLDQHAEDAFQLQEAAMRVGYAPAALPLWEHFLCRFFSYQVRCAIKQWPGSSQYRCQPVQLAEPRG